MRKPLLPALLGLLLPLQDPALAADKITILSQQTLFDSFSPLSTHPDPDPDSHTIFLGGMAAKKDGEEYQKKIAAGANPEEVEGPERIYSLSLDGPAPIPLSRLRPVLARKGWHLTKPAVFRLPGSEDYAMVFMQGKNKVAEECRKKGESLRVCVAYALSTELGWATSTDKGASWVYKGTLVKAEDSGDQSGAASPAVVPANGEVWVYYTTGRQNFAQENLFRQRFDRTLTVKIGPPARVKLSNFSIGLSLENPQTLRLRCETNTRLAITLVGNLRPKNALPLYFSRDGVNFRLAAESLISFENRLLAQPAQLLGPASRQECESENLSGVLTQREILYAEQYGPELWQEKKALLRILLP